ncbi:MAG: tRNA uridine-5-carboxymethylaminomethyl(34) synthesis GTPase MnmE [Lachnospiraceae bacterium]|nr:tRNA uridine-5-carboxymethylaminomethyl(34) synthesis GTPase MnmE [Lachnospiraceae bacterium]
MKTDTIAAIATAVSASGIGIIRISGEDAIRTANHVYRAKNPQKNLMTVKSHTIHYGFIYDGDELIDEVMVAVMRSPNTYTKEDTVEIDCHGGILVMNQILNVLLKNGCRLAEPGEFTKRAYLNGRIDLSKAEAVMDLIHSKNEFALKASLKQLRGGISDKVRSLRDRILSEIAYIEAALDDPEHISLEDYPASLEEKVLQIKKELKQLIDNADQKKMLKEGVQTVIVGKPNAGKSSLLNVLVGEDRAIVTSVAGTTRDVLEETIKLHGIGLNIIDTAGIRNTEDEVEKIGVGKARSYAEMADLILYVVDSSRLLDEDDESVLEMIKDKKVIVLLNKSDLDQVVSEQDIQQRLPTAFMIRTSMKDNTGIDQFEEIVKTMFFGGDIAVNDELYITNQRHKEALTEAYESMEMVLQSLAKMMPEDFYSIDLMSAYASLGRILGEEVGEALVDEIFSKFCMGK